ncbi:MAG: 50S ribosomal protein L12 [Candidatus Pacearchaeota archaeon]
MENVYAALLLHKAGKEVSEENLKSVVAATGATPNEDQIKSLVASLKGVDIDAELASASLVSSASAGSAGSAAPAEEKKEEKPKEEKKEAAAEGLSALFG